VIHQWRYKSIDTSLDYQRGVTRFVNTLELLDVMCEIEKVLTFVNHTGGITIQPGAGGVLCTLKIKKRSNEVQNPKTGKNKTDHQNSENKLNFNFKKREFTRLGLLLSLACALSLCSSAHHAPINHQTPQHRPTPSHLISDQPLSIINQSTPPIASPSHPNSPSSSSLLSIEIQNFETKQANRLAPCPRSSRLPQGKFLCEQVSSFAIVNQQTMKMSLLFN
jgi:hypothetical protein